MAELSEDVKQQPIDSEPSDPMQQLIFRLCILVGGAYFFYHSALPHHLFSPSLLYLIPYRIATTSVSLFMLVTIYLVIWKHLFRRTTSFRHWRIRTRKPVVLLCLIGVVSYVSYSVAFWPVYGAMSPLIFTLMAYIVLCALSFV